MLSRLEMRGFKSFADDVTLTFSPGVNVIVGPNGSGKSNLSEAIVWALGEQRAGKLRAPGMADVIFTGGGARAGAGFAEVTLAFSDDDGAPDLEVARRLTQAGDSDYRLNRAGCRLLDLQDSLSARGLGPEGLAIIRQGQVEAICTSRPADRRAILDEASGVGVSKRRRRRAELKIARVVDRLDRARDIANELAGRARSLERQARAAERAAEVEAEVASATEALRGEVARQAHAELERADAHRRLSLESRELAVAERGRAQESLDAHEAERLRAAASASALSERAASLREAVERCEARSELIRERLASVVDRLAQRADERRQAEADLVVLEAQTDDAAQCLRTAAQALDADGLALRTSEEAAQEAARALDAAVATAAERAERTGRWEREIADLERGWMNAHAAHERALAREAALADLPNHALPLERAERRAGIAGQRRSRQTARVEALQEVARARQAAVEGASARLRLAASEADRFAGARAADPEVATVSGGLVAAPGMERALAAALGALADAPIAADRAQAISLIEGGQSTVVTTTDSDRRPAPVGARPLSEAVAGIDERSRPYVAQLLRNAWLVDHLDDVPDDATGVWVTAVGVAFWPESGVVSSAQSEWARRALHARATADALTARQLVDAAAVELDAARTELGRAEVRARAIERSARRLEMALEGATAAARRHLEQCAQASAERAELASRVATTEAALSDGRARGVALAADGPQSGEAALRAASERAANELRNARARAVESRGKLTAAEGAVSEIEARQAIVRARLATAGAAVPDLDLVRRAGRATAAVAVALRPASDVARAERDQARQAVSVAEAALVAARAGVDAAVARERTLTEALHTADVDRAVAAERAQEAGAPPPADQPIEGTLEALTERLAAAERRRVALGIVNPLAASERAELAEREAEIAEQVADLDKVAATLREHLAAMEDAVSESFDRLFNSVAGRFTEVVGLLFPGGTGRLTLVEPEHEGDEPGVELEVVPAGKRPRPLSLLSGGERSLIALAFLLAVAMSRPAPMYVLDEVEAALDDVNLRRFLGVIRRLADETQFVLITHQQPTVEVADTLFGVTMGQDGVSQVVSRRLARSVEGPARPYVRRALRAVQGGRSA